MRYFPYFHLFSLSRIVNLIAVQGPDSSDEELYAEWAEATPAVTAEFASLPDVETSQEQPEASGDFVFFCC